MSSWWDTSGFSNLASQALKTAQKRIDKVLDIEEDGQSAKNKKSSLKVSTKSDEGDTKPKTASDGDFWSAWMSPKNSESPEKESESEDSAVSSWSLPWGISSESEQKECEAEKKSDGFTKAELVGSKETLKAPKSSHLKPNRLKSAVSEAESKSLPANLDPSERKKSTDDSFIEEGASKGENISTNEKSIETIPSDKHEKEDSQAYDSLDTSCGVDILTESESLGGWDISDSVLKLVEGNEDVIKNAIIAEKSLDDIDSNEVSSQFLHDDVECVVTKTEATVAYKIDDLLDNSEKDKNTIKEETRGDYEYTSEKILPDLQEDNKISIEPLQEETFEDKDSELTEDKLQQSVNESEAGNLSKNILSSESSVSASDHDNSLSTSLAPVFSPDLLRVESHETDKEHDNVILDDSSQKKSCVLEDSLSSHTGKDIVDSVISNSDLDVDAHTGNANSTGSSETSRLDSSADTIVDRSYVEIEADDPKNIPYSLFGGEKDIEDKNVAQVDLSKSISPASSFVKCMIEEAMEESGKEDSGSDNHSSGSKSESSKIDSELEKSVYSGHESSDDIETTTSSDIEIISAPLLSSSDKQDSYDLPALKITLQPRLTSSDGKGYRRSDSQSSSSTQSKGGDMEGLSPERGDGHGWTDEEYQHPDLEAVQEEGNDNPYHPERLLKLTKIAVEQHISGGKKLAEMAEVLQARENKLVQMSKDNHQLMEDNSILRSQLQQSEETREVETADLKALTDEFTIRIGESEKKLQSALRDKESLKGQLTEVQRELEKRSQGSDLEALLEEKTDQVKELLEEGQKLSKQQLQSSNIIKKLRAKEKETDATLTSQKKKIEEQTKELERLAVVLDSKEQMEAKQTEAITQLNSAVQRQERDHSKNLSDLEDALEKSRGLQTALDNAYKEIAELHRSNASQDSKAQETALSVETSVREELRISMEREQMRFKQEREAFIMQADDLRLDMARLDKEHERREDLLREEITHLQQRLQQDEARSQDLSQSVTSATRPLLRQIENLQATFVAQSKAWEKVEKNLTDRLAEAQTASAFAQEKERTASENYMEASAKLASLEMTNSRLKQDKANLLAEKEANQSQVEELQDAKNRLDAQFETNKKTLNHEIGQLKVEKVQLESQLNLEKSKLEAEKKKCAALEEQIYIAERERPRSRGTPSPSPSMSVSRQESLVGSFHESFGMRLPYDDGVDSPVALMGTPKSTVYESLRQSGATVVVENLQAQLKLREGEIVQLQSEISQLERTRESMARELVNLTTQNEELQETKIAFQNLEQQYQELNNRYSAILLMYGEKEEQVQELRLDLQDVKEMYKTQIDALLAK